MDNQWIMGFINVMVPITGQNQAKIFYLYNVKIADLTFPLHHPVLAEIPASDGSQDVMSQLKDYPFRP